MLQFFSKLMFGHFRRHRLEALLCLMGIALGVAVVIAIESAVRACVGSFRGAVESIAERSTHSVFAEDGTIADRVYIELKTKHPDLAMAPVIDRGVLVSRQGQDSQQVARLIGIDVFSERSLRSFTQVQSALDSDAFRRFLTVPGEVVLVDSLAARIGAGTGDEISITAGGARKAAHVAGIMSLQGVARAQLTDLIVADLATAQELTGSLGAIDRIDLRLNSPEQEKSLASDLPHGLALRSTSQQAATLSDLIGSYKLNLNALSLMASFVAVFIVYNSMLVSVKQRTTSLGILRCLGGSRVQLGAMVLVEAIVFALLGGVLGVVGGWALSRGLVHQVSATINDLYATVRPGAVPLEASAFAKGLGISLVSGILGAAVPLFQAARSAPINSFRETQHSRSAVGAAGAMALFGAAALLLSVGVYFIPGNSPIAGFGMAFLVAVGFALLCPLLTRAICAAAEAAARGGQRLSIQMAAAGVARSLGITGVAVAAMMLAMSMSIGIRTMVTSFRTSLSHWVDRRFAEDIFVGPELLVNHRIDSTLDPRIAGWVSRQPETQRAIGYRARTIPFAGKPILLSATNVGELLASRALSVKRGLGSERFDAHRDVVISEPLAGRTGLSPGQELALQTPDGPRSFRVFAIFYDFGNERGNVMLDLATYADAWNDSSLSSIHVKLRSGVDPESAAARWSQALRRDYPVVVNSFAHVKGEIMMIFDRTFRVTDVLNYLAGGVAFCGLAGALLALALARRRDYSVLTAVGMSRRQTSTWVVGQGVLIAWTSALVACVAGTALAFVLSYVIQYRSFGWSIPTQPQPQFWVEAFVIATLAALVASVYPIVRLRAQPPRRD